MVFLIWKLYKDKFITRHLPYLHETADTVAVTVKHGDHREPASGGQSRQTEEYGKEGRALNASWAIGLVNSGVKLLENSC